MGLSQPLLLPLKTHWHFRKCHRFTSFSEDHFSCWCSWVIRQRPPRAPPHFREVEWEEREMCWLWVMRSERGKERAKRFEEMGRWSMESCRDKHARPSREKPLSWQRVGEIWRVAIHTADLFTALFGFPKHQKHPSASHSPTRPFDLGLCCFHKVYEQKYEL